MPKREIKFEVDKIYYIKVEGLEEIFLEERDYYRFLLQFFYAIFELRVKSLEDKKIIEKGKVLLGEEEGEILVKGSPLAYVLAFVLLPRQAEFILVQNKEKGIQNFLQRSLLGYSKFFNNHYQREGPLFKGRFKSALVGDVEKEILNLHLLPLRLLKAEILDYKWSSLLDYLGKRRGKLLPPLPILEFYLGEESLKKLSSPSFYLEDFSPQKVEIKFEK